MSDKVKVEMSISIFSFGFVCWLFLFFWGQGGWYRVDCALKVERACALIAAEYDKKDKP